MKALSNALVRAPQSRKSSASLRRLALRRAASVLGVGALLAFGLPAAHAGNYYWDGGTVTVTGNGDGVSQGGDGTWSTSVANWDTGSGTPHSVWVTGNTAVFGGTAGNVSLGSAISAAGLIFNSGGYTIATGANTLSIGTGGITTATGGTTTINGTVASVGSQTWAIGTGDTLQFDAAFSSSTSGNSFQLTSNGTTNITNSFSVSGKSTLAGTGTINLSGTEAFETSSGDYSGIAGTTVNNTAGTATFSPGTANGFYIGNTGSATQPSTLNITGGSVVISSNTRIFIGDGFSGTNIAGDGTLSVGGGTGAALFTTGTTANGSNFLGNASATGTVNLLTNGTFATNRNFATGAAGKGFVNFNGGTFQATGTTASLASGLTTTIAEGGATIAPQTFAITIGSNIGHGGTAATDGGLTLAAGTGNTTLSGVLSFTGGLTFNSGGTLKGNNTYAGATNINAFVDASNANAFGASGAGNGTNINNGGTVRYRDTSGTLAEAFTLNNGSSFLLYNNPGTTTLSGGLTLNANSTLQFQPQAQASTTTNITGAITDGTTGNSLTLTRNGNAAANSNDNVNLNAANTYGGSTTISDQLTNGGTFSVNLVGGDNRLPTTTVVTLTNAQLTLGDGMGASNQTLTGLTGTGTKAAVVGGFTSPSTLTLNVAGTDTYGGKLGGAATNQNNLALAVSGPGTVTLTGANTYTGGTTVSNGTLTLSGAGATLGTGALAVNNANAGPGTAVIVNFSSTANASQAVSGLSSTIATPSSGTNTVQVNIASGVTLTDTQSGTTNYAGSVAGGGTLSIGGTSSSAPATVNYTGTDSAAQTKVTANATLQLNNTSGPALSNPVAVATSGIVQIGADTQIATTAPGTPNPASVALNGGTFNANSHSDGAVADPTQLATTNVTQSMGALTLNGAASVFDFGAGNSGSIVAFADSSGTLGSGMLNVIDYVGGADALYIGTSNVPGSGGLSPTQLAQINFGGVAATQLPNGEIAPAPEPSVWAAFGIGLLGLGGLAVHARRRALAA